MATSALLFTPRGTVGDWYTDDEDPGPSSSTYGRFLSTTEDHMLIRRSLLPLPFPGPDLWHSRRAAWLAGSLILNPAAPKVAHDASLTNNEDAPRSSIDGSPPTSATTTTLDDHPKAVLSAIQSLSAKARGKLPSFLHPYSPSPTAPKSPSPPLTSLEKLEMLLAEPGAEENEKVWRQGGLEAVWRMLTDSKVLKQPMRLGLVVSPSFVCSGRALMVFGS